MWTKVEDAWLIAMLQALPLPWPEPAILAWLTYASRCCASGQPYWIPEVMSDRAHSRAQKCTMLGRAALVAMTGCGRKTAQRCLASFQQRQEPGFSRGSAGVQQGFRKGSGRTTKTPASTDRQPSQGFRKGSAGVQQGFSRGSATSRAPAETPTSNPDNQPPGLALDKSRVEKKNARTSRGRINLSDESAFQAIRARELARHPIGMDEAQARAAWSHLRELTEKHGAIMPRELHSDRRAAKRLTACLEAFGSGMAYTGWLNAGGASAGDTAPDEWLKACGVSI